MDSAEVLAGPREVADPSRTGHRRGTGGRGPLPVGWTRYLPTLLFVAFFIPNTRLRYLSQAMSLGRWTVLAAVLALAFLTARHLRGVSAASAFAGLSFLSLAVSLPHSSNPAISVAKWLVFAGFLVFWLVFVSRLRDRRDVHRVIQPTVVFFFLFMWLTPLASLIFPQPLWGYFRHLNGALIYTNALGQFLIFFGLPAALYKLETAATVRQRLLWQATLGLAIVLIFFSGSRTAAFTMALLLAIAFVRWRRWQGRLALPAQALVILLGVLAVPHFMGELQSFVYKYPGVSSLLESRASYWQDTRESFRVRRWTGSGFGVQEQQAESRLSFATTGSFREQGSTYLGLLEEVGVLGAAPFFVLLLVVAYRNGAMLLRSEDPLRLLFARTIVAGLLWGLTENYLLYLGNAASILFFNAFFLQERLLQLEKAARIQFHRRQLLAAQLRAAGLRASPA